MKDKTKKIVSLQGLRAIAFIGIFTEHAGLTHLGELGVSCFFVLSGFLMYYNYTGMDISSDNSIKNNIVFFFEKIKYLYPLHCLTLIVAMVLYWDNQRLDSVRHIIIWVIKVVFNLLLLQSWVPKAEFYFSFNAVSWYLSTLFAIYFLSNYIKKRINKIKNNYQIINQIVLIISVQSLISLLLVMFESYVKNVPLIISDDLTKYMTYIWPLYRFGDFYIGCLLGYIYKNKHFSVLNCKRVMNVIEVVSFASIWFLQLIYNKKIGLFGTDAFRYSLLYILDAMLLVYFTACSKGFLSKYVLSSRILVFLGNISGYAFLIHQLIIVIVRKIFESNLSNIFMALLSFTITIGLSYACCYIRCKKSIFGRIIF